MTTAIFTRPLSKSSSLVDRIGWISFFTLATGLCAWVEIPLPFTPVPITLQTMAVVASGIVIGRDGVLSQIFYLLLGAIGFPVFAGAASGLHVFFGATGGYFIGFVAAAALAGRYIHPTWESSSYASKLFKLFATSLIIFIPGVIQLAFVLNISFAKAFLLGFVPFIPGDVIKTLAVAGLPSILIRKSS